MQGAAQALCFLRSRIFKNWKIGICRWLLRCFRGGNWNNGSNNGPFYENWNNSPSNANINRGDRDILTIKICISLPKGGIAYHSLASRHRAENSWRVHKDALWVATRNFGM